MVLQQLFDIKTIDINNVITKAKIVTVYQAKNCSGVHYLVA